MPMFNEFIDLNDHASVPLKATKTDEVKRATKESGEKSFP